MNQPFRVSVLVFPCPSVWSDARAAGACVRAASDRASAVRCAEVVVRVSRSSSRRVDDLGVPATHPAGRWPLLSRRNFPTCDQAPTGAHAQESLGSDAFLSHVATPQVRVSSPRCLGGAESDGFGSAPLGAEVATSDQLEKSPLRERLCPRPPEDPPSCAAVRHAD